MSANTSLGSATAPSLATLSGSSTATAGVAQSYTVTLNQPALVPYTVTWLQTGSATLSAVSSTISVGGTTASVTATWPSATAGTIDFSISPTLSRAGNPIAVTVSAAPAVTLPLFTLRAPAVSGLQPFAFGHAFVDGDIAAGQAANAPALTDWQFTPLTYWPSGYVKHAIIAGRATVSAGVDLPITLAVGAAAGGTALAEADLTSALGGTSVQISVDSDITTLGSLIGTSALHTTVCTGPVLSSWVYRRAVSGNSHLVVFLEVRLFKGGAVEIFPWVENGYLSVAGPSNFVKTCTVTIGGVSRFSQSIDVKHHTRIPLINGSSYSYWVGTDPQVTPKHDTAYLKRTGLVPNVGSYGAPTEAVLNDTVLEAPVKSSYSPNTLAGDTIADSGGGGSGGAISVQCALYIASSADVRAWRGMIVHGLSSGSWSHHYRDELTNLPIAFSDRPLATLVDTSTPTIPTPTGGQNSIGPGMSHSVSYAFLPWLLTGRWWFLEELHFWATYGYLSTSAVYRGSGAGWHVHAQPRFRAWSLNMLAQAAAVTPASHPLRDEFVASWEANTSRHYGRFVSGTVDSGAWVSPIGVLGTYSGDFGQPSPFPPQFTSGAWWDGIYQQNYLAFVFGYTRGIGIPQSAQSLSDHEAVSNHSFKLVVGRADDGLHGRYNWRRFCVYGGPIGTDSAGLPLDANYSTMDQMYAELCAGHGLNASLSSAYGSTLKRHPAVDPSLGQIGESDITLDSSRTYGSTALAALSLAVDLGVPGANLGWLRVTSASNYSMFDSYLAGQYAQFSVKPRLPDWAYEAGQWPGVGEVVDLGTDTVNAAVGRTVSWWRAWSNTAYAVSLGRAGSDIAGGGGHTDGTPNDLTAFDIFERSISVVKNAATAYTKPVGDANAGEVADRAGAGWMYANATAGDTTMQTGESPAQHFWGGLLWLPENALPGLGATYGWLFTAGQTGIATNGNNGAHIAHKLRLGIDQQWTLHGTPPHSRTHGHCATTYDPVQRKVYFVNGDSSDPLDYYEYKDLVTGGEGATSSFSGAAGTNFIQGYESADFSDRWRCHIHIRQSSYPDSSNAYPYVLVIDPASGNKYRPTMSGSVPTKPAYDNIACSWSDALNCAIYISGTGEEKVWFGKPAGDPRNTTWTWSSQDLTGTLYASDGYTGSDGRPAFNRLKHIAIFGDYLLWAAATDKPYQLIRITPP